MREDAASRDLFAVKLTRRCESRRRPRKPDEREGQGPHGLPR